MKKTIVILALGVAAASTNAFATENWQGGFAGIDIGVGFNQENNGVLEFSRADGSNNTAAINNAFNESFDGKFEAGELIGGRVGYNAQRGTLVYGVVADFAITDIAEEQSAFSATPATYVERRELNSLATVRGRLGFAGESPLLPFLTGGLAYGDTDYSWEGNSGAFRGDNGEDGDGIGFTAGFGLDVKASESMTIGIEYLYVNLGDADFQTRFSGEAGGARAAFGNATSGGTVAQGSEDDFVFQTIRLNVSWKF